MRRLLIVLLLAPAFVFGANAPNANTIRVEFQPNQTSITPGDPTINIVANPSVTLNILPGSDVFAVAPILSVRGAQAAVAQQLKQLSSLPESTGLKSFLDAKVLALSTKSLTAAEVQTTAEELSAKAEEVKGNPAATTTLKESAQALASTESTTIANAVLLRFHRIMGESAQERAVALSDPAAGWDIYLRDPHSSFDFPVTITCLGAPGDGSTPDATQCPAGSRKRTILIHVTPASWAIAASAGVMFPWLRDERYRTEATSDGTATHLVRVHPDGSLPYYLVSYLHYCPIGGIAVLNAFCPSLGVGTKVPSSGVLFTLGLSGHIKPLENVNSGYLDFGIAYGPHKVLNDDYVHRPSPITVPSGTSASNLLTTRYAFKAFVGISIGITADIDKFRGLYSGTKGGTQTTPAPAAEKK